MVYNSIAVENCHLFDKKLPKSCRATCGLVYLRLVSNIDVKTSWSALVLFTCFEEFLFFTMTCLTRAEFDERAYFFCLVDFPSSSCT